MNAVHRRVGQGMRRPANWFQLVKFCAVGASGYVVNLSIFAICVGPLEIYHLVAAPIAFVFALTNNFWWNRHWTFGAADGHAGFQAVRFFTVSTAAFGINFVVLALLVDRAGLPEIPAQALAIAAATPVNFIGNKLWSFGRGRGG